MSFKDMKDNFERKVRKIADSEMVRDEIYRVIKDFESKGDVCTQLIMESKDYDSFSFINSNRLISEDHVGELIRSINSYGWITNPIVVNQHKQIIDGQHRFTALKRMNKPIQYVISYDADIRIVRAMNEHQKAWKVNDHCNLHTNEKVPEFEAFSKFHSIHNLFSKPTLYALVKVSLQKNNGWAKKCKSGILDITEEELDVCEKRIEYVEKYLPMSRAMASGKAAFLRIINWIYTIEEVDKEKLFIKLNTDQFKSDLIYLGDSNPHIIDKIDEMYNRGESNKFSIKNYWVQHGGYSR